MRCADDTLLIAATQQKLQELLDITIKTRGIRGLSVNVKKTECMVVSKKNVIPKCELHIIGNENITQVQEFKYVGSTVTSNGKCNTETEKQMGES